MLGWSCDHPGLQVPPPLNSSRHLLLHTTIHTLFNFTILNTHTFCAKIIKHMYNYLRAITSLK